MINEMKIIIQICSFITIIFIYIYYLGKSEYITRY